MLGVLSSTLRIASRQDRWNHTGNAASHLDLKCRHLRRRIASRDQVFDELRRFIR